jgi:hypothetical protein
MGDGSALTSAERRKFDELVKTFMERDAFDPRPNWGATAGDVARPPTGAAHRPGGRGTWWRRRRR